MIYYKLYFSFSTFRYNSVLGAGAKKNKIKETILPSETNVMNLKF